MDKKSDNPDLKNLEGEIVKEEDSILPIFEKPLPSSETDHKTTPLKARLDDIEFNDESQDGSDPISQEDLDTLPRVPGTIPWACYAIAFVELCERFSYYGTTAVYVNYIQHPLPPGSKTGASGKNGQPGALNMGQRTSTALITFNSMWAYILPVFGAYVADQHWGRLKTIMNAIYVALIGHIFLIVSALPVVLQHRQVSLVLFILGLIIMGVGTGGFKSNISPLVAEQIGEKKMKIVRDKSGQRVLQDPNVTVSRVFMYFYMGINVGSLIGQISMVYAEKFVGFWSAFTLPTAMFCLCPIVLFVWRNQYESVKPRGSPFLSAYRTFKLAMHNKWTWNPIRLISNLREDNFWDQAKPSMLASPPEWMTFDDLWVDELSRGLQACKVFLWYPLYWLSYNQMLNNLISQASTMKLNGVPNDIITNFDPLALVVLIPVLDKFVYPTLRKKKIRFSPIRRMTAGFGFACASMIAACVIQYYIYKLGPCGKYTNDCVPDRVAPISVWIQAVPYVLIATSEIFASVTGLEYAYTKAPENMRSIVMAIYLFMSAISSAVSQAFVGLSDDPLLVLNYLVVAVLAFLGSIGFWFTLHHLDDQEDELNRLSEKIQNRTKVDMQTREK